MVFLAANYQDLFPWLFGPCRCSCGIEEERERRRQGALTGGSGSTWVKQHFSVFECVVDKKTQNNSVKPIKSMNEVCLAQTGRPFCLSLLLLVSGTRSMTRVADLRNVSMSSTGWPQLMYTSSDVA
jgi:hypothetical protein